MPDEIDIQQLEQAEKELEEQLAEEGRISTTCPACGSSETTPVLSLLTINIVAITAGQFLFFMVFRIGLAILAWIPMLLLSLFALYLWIYTPEYCCANCHQIFRTKPRRFFT